MAPHFKHIVLPLHIGTIGGAFYLYQCFQSYHLLCIFIGYFLFSGLGIAVGFHRLLSHRSFITAKWIEQVISICGCYAAQGSPLFWKALHMGFHHPYSDSKMDIHTPKKGFWYSYMGWQIHLLPQTIPLIAARDLLTSPFQTYLHKNYNRIYWLPIALLAIVRLDMAIALMVIPSFLSLHTENFINSFCHTPSFGYRNFDSNDQSRNIILLGIFCFGQGWHNNHHKYPKRYNYGGERWFEIDPAAVIISILKIR